MFRILLVGSHLQSILNYLGSKLFKIVQNNVNKLNIIKSYGKNAFLVSSVLPDYLPCLQLPEPDKMVAAGGNEVCRVSGEGTVPNPSLMAS